MNTDELKSNARLASAVGYSRPTLEKLGTVMAATKSKDKEVRALAVELVAEMDRTGKVSGAATGADSAA